MKIASRCVLFILSFCALFQFAIANEFQYFIGCSPQGLEQPRERRGAIARGTPEYNDIANFMRGITCTMESEYSVVATCDEDNKTARVQLITRTGDYLEKDEDDVPWTRCQIPRPPTAVAPRVTPEYSCEYVQRAPGAPVAYKYAIDFNVSTFPMNVSLGEENRAVVGGLPMGNYYLQYICNKNQRENPTETSVSFKYGPGTRARAQVNITGGETYPEVKHCDIERGKKVAIGIVDCKAYKNHAAVLTPQALNEKTRKYSAECGGSGPTNPNDCAALRKELYENAPDFAMVCLGNNKGVTAEEKTTQKRLADIACGVCPPGQKMQTGRCVPSRESTPDPKDSPTGCARANGYWHPGPSYCEVCTGDKVPGATGCVEKSPTATKTLPHCSAGSFMSRDECKCNTDEDQEGGRPTAVTCKKKETPKPRDFTPPKVEPKQGDECVDAASRRMGRIGPDNKTCLIERACLSACDEATQQCQEGRCVPKQATKPPPQAPCNPAKSPCGQVQQPRGPQGGQPGGAPRSPQQQGKQDPFSQLAKQMGQKGQGSPGQGGQGQGQPQQDPSLMQRLMQMFQPQPFSNMFGNTSTTAQIECESFEIDAEETTGGLYRVKKGEPIEVTWSVTGAKRVSVDTTPRSTTKYDRDTGTSATVTPGRTGTLTIRLKIDNHLFTKEPCRAKKVRVR